MMEGYLCLVIFLLFNPLYRGGVRLRAQTARLLSLGSLTRPPSRVAGGYCWHVFGQAGVPNLMGNAAVAVG